MSQPKSEVNNNNNNNRAITYNAGEDITRFEKNKRAELKEHQGTIDMMGRFHELWTGNLDDAVMEIKMQALLSDVKRQVLFLTDEGAKKELFKRQALAQNFIQNHLIMAVNLDLRSGLNDYAPMIEAQRMHSLEDAFTAFRNYFSRGTLSGPKIIPHLKRAISTLQMDEKGQTVAQFHEIFLQNLTALRSAGGNMPEEDLASIFLIGLTNALRVEVNRMRDDELPTTLSDAFTLAANLAAVIALTDKPRRSLTTGMVNSVEVTSNDDETAQVQVAKGFPVKGQGQKQPVHGNGPPQGLPQGQKPYAPRARFQRPEDHCPLCKGLFFASHDVNIRYGTHTLENCPRAETVLGKIGLPVASKRPGQPGGYAQAIIGRDPASDGQHGAQHPEDASVILNVTGLSNDDLTLMDSGASHHIFRASDDLTFDERQGSTLRLSMMTGEDVLAKKTVKHSVWGRGWLYPNAKYSLLSLSTLIEQGWEVSFNQASCDWRVQRDGVNHWFRKHENRLFAWDPAATTTTGAASATEGTPVPDGDGGGRDAELLRHIHGYHVTMGHPSPEKLIDFLTMEDRIGQTKRPSETELRRAMKNMPACHSCLLGNSTWKQTPHLPLTPRIRAKIGQILHMDIVFANKEFAFLLSKDENTGYTHFPLLRSKNKEDLFEAMIGIVNWYAGHDRHVKTIATDHEINFLSVESDMNGRGIQMSYRAPGMHEKFAERQTRTVKKVGRALIAECDRRRLEIPFAALPHALAYAVHTINLMPNTLIKQRSPYTMVTRAKIHDSDLHVGFGDVVIAKTPARSGDNAVTDLRAEYGFVLDHGDDGGAKIKMLVLDSPSSRPVIVTRHIYRVIEPDDHVRSLLAEWDCSPLSWLQADNDDDEDDPNPAAGVSGYSHLPFARVSPAPSPFAAPTSSSGSTETSDPPESPLPYNAYSEDNVPPPSPGSPPPAPVPVPSVEPTTYSEAHVPPPPSGAPPSGPATILSQQPTQGAIPTQPTATLPLEQHPIQATGVSMPAAQPVPRPTSITTRSGRVTNNPDYTLANLSGGWGSSQMVESVHDSPESAQRLYGHEIIQGAALLQFAQLKKLDPDAAQQALDSEFLQLDRLDTFEPVHASMIPSEDLKYNTIHSMVVGAVKYLHGAAKAVFKARLVARGNEQELLPFTPTSSPTLPYYALFVLLTIAASHGLKIRTHDIVCAYPNAKLPGSPVYMWMANPVARIAVHHHPTWIPFLAHDGRLLVLLKNALYGLKESGLLWHKKITEVLTKNLGHRQVPTEPNIFHRGKHLLAGIYVDDLILAFRDKAEADALRAELLKAFPEGIKEHNGDVEFLGILIEQPKDDSSIFMLSQRKQLAKLMAAYPLPSEHRVVSTPSRLDLQVVDATSPPGDQKLFAKKVGEIAHLVVTRPDIAVTVSILQSFTHQPTEQNMRDLDRLLAYLFATKDYGLIIAPTGPLVVDASADASYGTRHDGYSHGGSIVTVAGTPVFWTSKKISLIADSSTRAEIAQAHATLDHLCSIRDLVTELGYELPPSRLLQDNQSAMTLFIDGHGKAARSKPWQIRVAAVKEHLVSGDIVLEYQPTEQMAADGLTKCLPPSDFQKFRSRMHVFDLREVRLAGRSTIFSHGGVLGI